MPAQTPLESPPSGWHRGGNNPWDLEGNLSAVQYLMNIGSEDAHFKVRVATGEQIYFMEPQTVSPGETVAIDVRQLRDQQLPDRDGKTIPWDATSGELDWQWAGGAVLVGQLSQTTPTVQSVSPMYARRCCCSVPSDISFWLSPGSLTKSVGQTYSFTAWEHDQDCNGDTMGEYNPWVSWSISPGIASISGSGAVGSGTCNSPGTATVQALLNASYGIDASGEGCGCDSYNQQLTAYATLYIKPTVAISGPTKIPMLAHGTQGPDSIQLTAVGTPS